MSHGRVAFLVREKYGENCNSYHFDYQILKIFDYLGENHFWREVQCSQKAV